MKSTGKYVTGAHLLSERRYWVFINGTFYYGADDLATIHALLTGHAGQTVAVLDRYAPILLHIPEGRRVTLCKDDDAYPSRKGNH